MKRPSRSFVVEVRRQRRPPGEPTPSWVEELQKPLTNSALRSAEPPPPQPVFEAAVAPARPAGRILPSLIETPPPAEPEAATATKPPKLAKPTKPRAPRRPQAAAPQPVRVAEPPLAVAAPPPLPAEPTVETVDQDRSTRHRRILARYVFGEASKPGERWKRRLRGEKS